MSQLQTPFRRCPWVKLDNPRYVDYHDREWGEPVHDDRLHFEFLVLEGAQAGLSWETILNKREGYRQLFKNFDPRKVAAFDASKIEQLLQDPRIIRNRQKIRSTVTNARSFLALQQEFGSFDRYIWSFVNFMPVLSKLKTLADYPARTELSDRVSKDLKRRGFAFVGSTIMYAHMQATGIVNDHSVDCFKHRRR